MTFSVIATQTTRRRPLWTRLSTGLSRPKDRNQRIQLPRGGTYTSTGLFEAGEDRNSALTGATSESLANQHRLFEAGEDHNAGDAANLGTTAQEPAPVFRGPVRIATAGPALRHDRVGTIRTGL